MSSTPVLERNGTSGSDVGGGLRARLDAATAELADLVSGLEPGCLTGPDAQQLYAAFVAAERFCVAAKTLLAPRIDASLVWAEAGHPNAASLMAALEGIPLGQARSTLELGRGLDQLPDTEAAIRQGKLSRPKAAEVIGAALLDPETEGELLAGAEELPLPQVKERCQRARASSAHHDPVAAIRRTYANRSFSAWSEADGTFCYRGTDTADRGAQILNHIDSLANRLRRQRRAKAKAGDDHEGATDGGRAHEPEKALRADAFFALVTRSGPGAGARARSTSGSKPGPVSNGTTEDPDVDPNTLDLDLGALDPRDGDRDDPPPDSFSLIDRPPTCSVMVRVDLATLLRGETHPGEICELDGQGPISPKMARDMANDSFLRFIFHESDDIRSIFHFGRTINKALRTALVHRDRICVVPGCDVSYGLEIDHIVPVTEGGPTTLDNLALLCHHHHFLKTFEGWTLELADASDPKHLSWRFEPLPPFGQEPDLGADGPHFKKWRRPPGRGDSNPTAGQSRLAVTPASSSNRGRA
jgi:hypothetical protein